MDLIVMIPWLQNQQHLLGRVVKIGVTDFL